jgi:hypothetical protein
MPSEERSGENRTRKLNAIRFNDIEYQFFDPKDCYICRFSKQFFDNDLEAIDHNFQSIRTLGLGSLESKTQWNERQQQRYVVV